ncbi:transcriptional regulator, LacI family [Arboricoccus pini]|uniref:Transcriptional regulator, LacI family n=1 Tax=Arboricoccus pini TaxID=1963835 RepID=A0A212RGF2_9PROT|nr:transcriptional regulator, LacI family [Arboricoccus pini]
MTTISRHLNGSIVLPQETVKRIDDAILALDYHPNPHARRLSLGRSETIGLVLPEIANPFFARLAGAVEEAADAEGLGLVLCATLNRQGRELDYLARLGRDGVDGLIFVTNHPDDGSLARSIETIPGAVLLDEDVPGTVAPKIFCDNEAGGYLAGQALLAAGHRRIGCIGGLAGMTSMDGRWQGLCRAVRECGPEAAITFSTNGPYSVAEGRRAARLFLAAAEPPSALFVCSEEAALGVLEGLRDADIDVPGDVSLIAFDDVGPLHLLTPPLTAIRQPIEAMGRRAVEAIVTKIGPGIELMPVELIVRQSVAPPPSANRKLKG